MKSKRPYNRLAMLAVKADYLRRISIKKLAVVMKIAMKIAMKMAMKMTMKMNCALKTVALPARFALNKIVVICCQRNQHV